MRAVKVDFLVFNYPLACNVILGRLTQNDLEAIISMALLTVKFLSDGGQRVTVRVD